jgi:DNA-binding XRE family transcriptional regulator
MHTRSTRPYRSRATRLGAAIGSRFFANPREVPMSRLAGDPQASIRAAMRRRRRALGLTQAQAAKLLGLSLLTYNRMELGNRRIHFEELGAICEAFACHIGELVEDGELVQAYTHAAGALLGQLTT